MSTNGHLQTQAWVTLLTKASYLPGVITLAHSLSKHKTSYPLVVLVTPAVPASYMQALELECVHNPLLLIQHTSPLLLPRSQKTTLIASRFEDTWTKLRAFELTEYSTCVFLDADIAVYKNMDDIFSFELPGDDWIAACHPCVCNFDHDDFAPSDWNARNCAYTPLSHPSALSKGFPVPKTASPPNTHTLINGGVFLYRPSPALWDAMHTHFLTSNELSTYKFPDQDFLAAFFLHNWVSLPWKYNALKTMKQWHTNIWRDDEVCGLHYIVDKPWNRRIASDGIGGHLGRDGETHTWWWRVWKDWRGSRGGKLVEIMDGLVATPLDKASDTKQCLENKLDGFPRPIFRDQVDTADTTSTGKANANQGIHALENGDSDKENATKSLGNGIQSPAA